jgi:hypothetical protein
MDQSSQEYYSRRERAERAAAKRATCPEARWAHQQLAQYYAAAQRDAEPAQARDRARASTERPKLSIVVPISA